MGILESSCGDMNKNKGSRIVYLLIITTSFPTHFLLFNDKAVVLFVLLKRILMLKNNFLLFNDKAVVLFVLLKKIQMLKKTNYKAIDVSVKLILICKIH